MKKEMRETGIAAVGDVPWGTHCCQFYDDKKDLLDILVPYFKAGLENNEFCMWVTSEPLGVEDATRSLRKAVNDLDHYIEKGQIEILDAIQWYTQSGKFESEKVLQSWVEEHDRALERGFDGLRLTGNTFWLEDKDWTSFVDYEAAMDCAIGKYRMLAICSYSLGKCGASEVIDVVSNHQFALIRRSGKWETIQSAERKQAEEALRESEERYRLLAESAEDLIFLVTPEMFVQYVNTAAARQFQADPENIIGKTLSELFPPGALGRMRGNLKKALETGESVYHEDEFEFPLPIGKLWLSSRLVPVRDRSGGIIGMMGISRNITKRRKIEEAMKGSEQRYRGLYESMRDGVVRCDMEGRILEVNHALLDMLGYTKEELKKLSYQQITPQKWHITDADIVQRKILARGYSDLYEKEYMTKDGTTIPIEIRVWLIKGKEGKPEGMWGLVRDITKRKRAEEEIESLAKFASENPNPVIRIAGEGTVLYANAASEPLLRECGASIGQPVPGEWRELIDDVLRSGHGKRIDKKCGDRILSFDVVPVVDGGYVNLYGRDVTERKRTEEALRASENKYRTLLENLPQKIFLKDRNSVYLSCNENYARDLKIKSEEIVGKTDYDFYPKQLAEKYRADDTRTMEAGKPEDIEEKYIQGGQEVTVHTVKMPVKNEQGDCVGVLGIFWDVTDRKRAEQALEEAERKFRTIFDNATDGILLADLQTKRFHAGNRMICQMLGYSREEVENLGIMDIHPKEQLPYVMDQFEKQLRKETTLTKDIPVRRKDGSVFYADVNSTPITLGKKRYLLGIFRDMTERKKAEEEKERLQEQLAHSQKMEALVTLAGGIAHEYNNIIAAIVGYVDLTLQTEELSDAARRNLEVVRNSGVRGADLTRSLLAFSKNDAEERKPVNLRDVVDAVLRMTAREFTSEGIELAVNHSTRAPQVVASAPMLQSVVMNLIINARHALLESKKKELIVETGERNGRAFVRVEDTGCGIPEENISRVFDPFFTTKGALVSGKVFDGKAHGTGLGLSVSHSIVESHGGEIEVQSQVGKGTAFTVYLPALPERRPRQTEVRQKQQGTASRILVVDDEEALAQLLVDILDSGGYEADGFTNPEEAVKALQREKYAVALIDLQMPEMQGGDFMAAINDLPMEKRPVKVILTGRLDVSEGDYTHLGVFETLRKPFTAQQVIAIVERSCLAGRTMQDSVV